MLRQLVPPAAATACGPLDTWPPLAEVGRLGRVGGDNALKMLRQYLAGRHDRGVIRARSTLVVGDAPARCSSPSFPRILWRENILSRHCSQIAGQETLMVGTTAVFARSAANSDMFRP